MLVKRVVSSRFKKYIAHLTITGVKNSVLTNVVAIFISVAHNIQPQHVVNKYGITSDYLLFLLSLHRDAMFTGKV